jgi:hypothetical protein
MTLVNVDREIYNNSVILNMMHPYNHDTKCHSKISSHNIVRAKLAVVPTLKFSMCTIGAILIVIGSTKISVFASPPKLPS